MSSSSFDSIKPAGWVWAVTPADTDLPRKTRAIRVGTAGDVSVRAFSPVTKTLTDTVIPGVTAGETLVIEATRINSTGTTASGITALA
jgi:hypothetical protein